MYHDHTKQHFGSGFHLKPFFSMNTVLCIPHQMGIQPEFKSEKIKGTVCLWIVLTYFSDDFGFNSRTYIIPWIFSFIFSGKITLPISHCGFIDQVFIHI